MKGFPWYCHKILPLVYDESLSYYEVLCKLTKKINDIIELAEKLEKAYEEILSYYENIRQEIDEAIDEKYAQLDAEVKAELEALELRVNAKMNEVLTEVEELTTLVNTYYDNSKNYTDAQLAIERSRIDSKVNALATKLELEIDELRKQISEGLALVEIYNPTTGFTSTIEQTIKDVYDSARVDEGLTVAEYYASGITVGEYATLNMRVKEYAMAGKKIIHRFYKWFYNPITGIKNTVENLASWSMTRILNTASVTDYNNAGLTVDEYYNTGYTVETYLTNFGQ